MNEWQNEVIVFFRYETSELFYMDVLFIHILTIVCLTADYAWFVFFCLFCFVPCFFRPIPVKKKLVMTSDLCMLTKKKIPLL